MQPAEMTALPVDRGGGVEISADAHGALTAIPGRERSSQSGEVAEAAEIRAVTKLPVRRRDDDVIHAGIIALHRIKKARGVDQLIEGNAERQRFFDNHGDRAADLLRGAESLLREAVLEALARPIRDERGCRDEDAAYQQDESALQVLHCADFGRLPPSVAAAARLRAMKSGMPRAISSPSTGRRRSGFGLSESA